MGLYQALMALKVFVICWALLALCAGIPHAAASSAPASDTGKTLLIYVYSPDCGACRQFDSEIGPIYPKTTEAARLPLHKVLLDDWQRARPHSRNAPQTPLSARRLFCKIQRLPGTGPHHGVFRCGALLAFTPANDESP